MRSLPLTASDFQEILSSLFMAELDYAARMKFSKGASLVPEFVPTKDVMPDLETTLETVRTMFGVELATLSGELPLVQWAKHLHAEWERTDQRITFFTSGSTGKPKPATHHFALMEQEIHALAEVFANRRRVVSFVPRHHIYGFLFSILLPKALDCHVRWEVPLPTPGLVDSLIEGDLMVAFPLLWGKLEEMNVSFGTGVNGVTSTGPCPAETIRNLRANGLDAMYEIYGSSETGGVGYRNNPDDAYTLLPYWSKSDEPTAIQRTLPTDKEQTYLLQDALDWATATTFTPLRRADNAVQVAGINVYPSRVREVLLDHPDVADCAVRLMRPEEGTRLKALLIPNTDSATENELISAVRKWAKGKLSPYEMPGAWAVRKTLSVNELGKTKDW